MSSDLETLVAAWRGEREVPVPYFGGKTVSLFFDDEDHLRAFGPALLRFFALTVDDRVRDTLHAYAYFQDTVVAVGMAEGWIAAGMETLSADDPRIWDYVDPKVVSASRAWEVGNRNAEADYVDLEANCGWEEEHGLQMCWRDGSDLVKLGPYDGHTTNAHAYDDDTKDAFVYNSFQGAAFSTPNPLFKSA